MPDTPFPFDYARSTALVTGASRGIGACIARSLASRGCPDMVLTARSEKDLRELATELSARFGVRTHVVPIDLAEPGASERLKAETDRLGLSIDLLVNNAGFGDYGPYENRPLARQEQMIAVNCAALAFLTRLYLPAMIAQKRGGIINIASTASFQPVPYMSVYGATKAFVLSFSEALWAEMEDLPGADIRIVCLCPGGTATDFDFGDSAARGKFEGTRMSTPESVAQAGIRALDRNASYAVVGVTNYLGSLSARIAPRATVARFAASLFRPEKAVTEPTEESATVAAPAPISKTGAVVAGLTVFAAVVAGARMRRRR